MSNPSKTLEQALQIIEQEVEKIDRLSSEGKEGATLGRAEAQMLTDYVKTLVAVRKDERDQAKEEDLSKKTDNELDELAAQALKYLKTKEEPQSKKGKKNEPTKTKA